MKTITFYSYKGGVGRTLVVANVAKYLAQFGLAVVALDLDLEAPGLHYKFALDGEEVAHERGVVDYIRAFLDDGRPPDSVLPFTTVVRPQARGVADIHLMPAGSAPRPAYWEALAAIDWHKLLYRDEAPGVALFAELKATIEAELRPDYLLIDARTGITEMSGIATTLLADVVVTLCLNTDEHMEGARSVMRSINRTRRANGDSPVQLEVALARLPEMVEEDVRRTLKRATDYLTSPADDESDSLSLDEPVILHADPSLQVHEHLLIGSELRVEEEEPLLSDYLQLFARFIPLESLAPRVQELVTEAMDRLLDDPLSTERSLKVLARYTGHPEALRALIRFYRVRQDHEEMLGACSRLWKLTGSEDLGLIWTAVQEGFDVAYPYDDRNYPIDFVREVWQAEEGRDETIGLRLAHTLDNFSREEEAVEIALDLFDAHPDSEPVAESVLTHMHSAGMYPEAFEFGADQADRFAYDPDYVAAWAAAAAELGDRELAERFLDDERVDLQPLQSRAPGALFRLLRSAGRAGDLGPLLNRALEEAVRARRWDALFELAEEYARRGVAAQRRFETVIRRQAPDSADAFLRDVAAQTPGWGERASTIRTR